ncbi:MAG: hypothetical protein IH599_04925 [Bacteroidales bacterium]|nr:hypothetical protein [Bacteroidales bacterium]
MKMKLPLSILVATLFFLTCIQGQAQDSLQDTPLHAYYHPFPPKGKTITKVFRNVNEPDRKVKWVFQGELARRVVDGKKKKVKLLTVSVYDSQGRMVEQTINRIGEELVILESFRFWVYDSTNVQPYECDIIDSVSFDLVQKQGDRSSWRIGFKEVRTGNIVSFRKVTEFKGWIGPKKAMKMEDRIYYDVADIRDRRDQVSELYFQEGKGLVEYHTIDRNAMSRLFILESTQINK